VVFPGNQLGGADGGGADGGGESGRAAGAGINVSRGVSELDHVLVTVVCAAPGPAVDVGAADRQS
jgi:hypothetical protein